MSQNQPKVFGRMVDDDRVNELIAAYSDGTATDEQCEELSKLIATSPEVCDYYIAHSALVSQLVTYSNSSEYGPRKSEKIKPPVSKSRRLVGWTVAIAASIVIVVTSIYTFRRPDENSLTGASAEVVGQLQTDLASGESSAALSNTDIIVGRQVSFDRGNYRVLLTNGVKLSVAGPASFTIVDSMQCRLAEGRLTADVPDTAKGFCVVTADADIVDQGTRFGVAVSPESGTDIAVFEGRVDVASMSQEKTLFIGRAASVAKNGTMSRLQTVKPDTFEAPRVSGSKTKPTILSVSDNIRSADEFGFYRIVPQGFGEDQPAYVDREHQWNGVDEGGLPKELLGGDYVMPFNSDKHEEEIQMTLTLSQVANLYVLFDDRVETPQWLIRDFVRTGEKVGQDEGGVIQGFKTGKRTTVGPGNSIDSVFSVWQRREPVVGIVTLEGLWDTLPVTQDAEEIGLNERSMFGIVAVPVSAP